jgi:hypothetical protein
LASFSRPKAPRRIGALPVANTHSAPLVEAFFISARDFQIAHDLVRILRRAGVAEELIEADIAPVEQIFRDRLRVMFGARSRVS